MAERKVAELAMTFGSPVHDADPGEVVLERISVLAGHVRWLQARVESLSPDEVVWNRTRVKVGGQDGGTTEEAHVHVWVTLYERWNNALTGLCLDALRIGLKEREVRLAEAQGAAIVTMLDGLLAELGHDGSDPGTAAIVARHLRLVAEDGLGQRELVCGDDDEWFEEDDDDVNKETVR